MTVIKLRDYDFTTNDGDEPVLMFSGIGGLAKDPFSRCRIRMLFCSVPPTRRGFRWSIFPIPCVKK